MGQKSSVLEEPSNISFASQDSPEMDVKSKKPNLTDVNELLKPKPQLESGDPPILREVTSDDACLQQQRQELPDKNADLMGKLLLDEYVKDERKPDLGGRYFTKTCLNPDFLPLLDNPSIAELSQLTALKMMQNFEEFAKLDQFWKSQISKADEKLMDDNVSEKDFRTINYEDLPTIQLVDNKLSPTQDTATATSEIQEITRVDVAENIVEREKSSKVSEEEEANSETSASSCSAERNDVESSSTLRNESAEEMLRLKTRLSRLELERDEAMLKLKRAEERCEASQAESRSLEATLSVMEEKLRNMVSELNEEVKKNKGLEYHPTQSLQEQQLDCEQIETLASID